MLVLGDSLLQGTVAAGIININLYMQFLGQKNLMLRSCI